jgi:hypothetical protein
MVFVFVWVKKIGSKKFQIYLLIWPAKKYQKYQDTYGESAQNGSIQLD